MKTSSPSKDISSNGVVVMRGTKGNVMIDVIVGTAILLTVSLALMSILKAQKLVVDSNAEVMQYQSVVITRLTEVEKMDILTAAALNGITDVHNNVSFSYSCIISEYNTLHIDVTATKGHINRIFILEKEI